MKTPPAIPREPAFWSCSDDDELLTHREISEAVEAWADQIHPEPLPEFVTVYGYGPMDLPSAETLAGDVLARTLEGLDEDYADPDEMDTKPTDEMKAAALEFAMKIRALYEPWMHHQITSRSERVADHVPADWLTQPSASHPASHQEAGQ